MLETTRGIVFHTARYSETSAVVVIYTEKFGLLSFIVKGIYSRKSNIRPAAFGPLSIIDLVIEKRNHASLHYIREIGAVQSLPTVAENLGKGAIVLFLNELLYRCIREEVPDSGLYHFLQNALDLLNRLETPSSNFHLLFMIRLSRLMGFAPRLTQAGAGGFFDMEEGLMLSAAPMHPYFIGGQAAKVFEQLMQMRFEQLHELTLTADLRNELLDRLLEYYRLHIPGLGELKSVRVLQELLA